MDQAEDPRTVELQALLAIFPEIQTQSDDAYSFTLEIPVNPQREVLVCFPANHDAPQVVTAQQSGPIEPRTESHSLSHLPPLQALFSLPDGYPAEQPPRVTLSTSPAWLSSDCIHRLEADALKLWEDSGRDLVVYAYIDHLRQAADDVFGMLQMTGTLELSPEHKIALLDHDVQAKRAAFDRGTFDCGVCLEPKKGLVCHRMTDCGHVFCRQCLQDFYNDAIKQGDLATVRCLEPSCAKEREKAAVATGAGKRKAKTFISPGELLQIPLEKEVVQRYVNLKYKTELESDKDTVYCPRSWCQGAARSKKHRKPEGLVLLDADGDDPGQDDATSGKPPRKPDMMAQQLAICEDCCFAFCSRCNQSWHGEFYYCSAERERKELLSAEEQASLEYLKLFSTKCPTCGAPAQKSMGCNHMTCFRCQTHFCYLCSAWLDPNNPYKHFNRLVAGKRTTCYNRLWELEAGDGAGAAEGYNVRQEWEFEAEPDGEWDGGDDGEDEEVEAPRFGPIQRRPAAAPNRRGGGPNRGNGPLRGQNAPEPLAARPQNVRVEVERQGPLVLRIEANVVPAEPGPGVGAMEAQLARPPDNPGARLLQAQVRREGGAGQARGGFNGRGGRGRQNVRRPAGNGVPRHAAENRRHAVAGAAENGADLFGDNVEDLDAAQQAWIRQFVQLALEDEEDTID